MLGVVKLVPVPRLDPPVAAAYQLIVPAEAVAPSVTVPVPQILPGVIPVIVGIGFTVVVILLLIAGLFVAQGVTSDVSERLTTSPLFNVEVVNVEAVAPGTFIPLIRHLYVGVPMFAEEAIEKVTDCPAQIILSASLD